MELDLMTRDEVLQHLQLTEQELDRAISDGMLSEFRLGKRTQFHRHDVEALAEMFATSNN